MRVLIAEDSALFREGLAGLLTAAGHEIAASLSSAEGLVDAVIRHEPSVAVIDVRMPPTMTDDGADAAREIRQRRPDQPIMLLSQHLETRHSVRLVSTGAFGYLLKDRVLRVEDFLDALVRVAAGGSALDPAVVSALLAPRRSELEPLSPREREVLGLVAEGHTNAAIAGKLFVTDRTVESHLRSIFQKLDLDESAGTHRRVHAVLTYLRASGHA